MARYSRRRRSTRGRRRVSTRGRSRTRRLKKIYISRGGIRL